MSQEDWIALVGPEVEENLSLRYLASSAEAKGLRTELFPFNSPSELTLLVQQLLSGTAPLVVAISLSFQWRALDVLALALALREQGYQGHITGGGHFASFACLELLRDFPELDSICRYEAEETFAQLCLALQNAKPLSQIAGLVLKGSPPVFTDDRPPPPVATLPWPDRRGPSATCLGHPISPMVSSRGCYANCSFCCIAALHKAGTPLERHRLRPVQDVAAEMAWLHKDRNTEIFIFHDDNFFLPRPNDSLARINALADELDRLGTGRFATIAKARPNDVTEPVFRAMRERFGLVRLFLGVESSTHQGCITLGRGHRENAAKEALRILEQLGIYTCFNMLVFDPDADTDSLLANLAFMQEHGIHPSNFGRVELYAGTPLLERLQRENRAVGDYVSWDYDQAGAEMQRVFELAMIAFHERNFSGRALANRLQSTRFDAEIAQWFHPHLARTEWIQRAKQLSQRISQSSYEGIKEIVEHVRSKDNSLDTAMIERVSAQLRSCEDELDDAASSLEQEIQWTVGRTCMHAPSKGIPVPRNKEARAEYNQQISSVASGE